ncbi:MAG: aminoacyl-tRNA hydrolase, partial [Pseudomonadota bacterium]
VVIQADAHRSQARNREEARERLAALIAAAAERPKPRVATKPTKGSVRRRLDGKAQRGQVKRLRGRPDEGDQG